MASAHSRPRRIIVFGASGTIGRAVVEALVAAGYKVVAVTRRPLDFQGRDVEVRLADVQSTSSVRDDAFRGEQFDAVISCLASRTGAPKDAQAIDYAANCRLLEAAKGTGTEHFILLSAICVQKPRLAFQHAKLAFEDELVRSGLTWSIIRPTAFFKSLSGQVERVRKGKSFLLFGDGNLTRCKPISDCDLARYIVAAVDDPAARNRILPIGGPGPAISPREQGEMLFELTGQIPRFRSVPPGVFLAIGRALRPVAAVSDWAAEKAEYLRIAHYYATESMLLLDPESGEYSSAATPEFGEDTLREHYRHLIEG